MWMHLTDIMLNERYQPQKKKYSMIPFMWCSKPGETRLSGDRTLSSGWLWGHQWRREEMKSSAALDVFITWSGWWLHGFPFHVSFFPDFGLYMFFIHIWSFFAHLFKATLLCHLRRVLQTIDRKAPCEVVQQVPGEKGVPTFWVSGIESGCVPSLLSLHMLSRLLWPLFSLCPWGVSASCWLLGFADCTVWFYFLFVCRLFLQGRRQQFPKIHSMWGKAVCFRWWLFFLVANWK